MNLGLALLLCLLPLLSLTDLVAQNQGKFYFHWGYNRSIYSRSDLHFSGPNYDFTLYEVMAQDAPSAFDPFLYFNPTTMTIPQYNMRLGYYLNER